MPCAKLNIMLHFNGDFKINLTVTRFWVVINYGCTVYVYVYDIIYSLEPFHLQECSSCVHQKRIGALSIISLL
jgi:hypothetical protein